MQHVEHTGDRNPVLFWKVCTLCSWLVSFSIIFISMNKKVSIGPQPVHDDSRRLQTNGKSERDDHNQQIISSAQDILRKGWMFDWETVIQSGDINSLHGTS